MSDGLDSCLRAARTFHDWLAASADFEPLMEPELDILVYQVRADDARSASLLARRVFQLAAEAELHLAMIEVPIALIQARSPAIDADAATVTCLRSVLMKPEHHQWLEPITSILEAAAPKARASL
jgi:hypothetical protein